MRAGECNYTGAESASQGDVAAEWHGPGATKRVGLRKTDQVLAELRATRKSTGETRRSRSLTLTGLAALNDTPDK